MNNIPSVKESSKALFQIVREEWPEGEPLTNKQTNTFHDAFIKALTAEREAGAREEREKWVKAVGEKIDKTTRELMLSSFQEGVARTREQYDEAIKALTPPTK